PTFKRLGPPRNSGFQQVVWVKEPLESRHHIECFVAIHGVQQFGASASIAVLTRQGPAVAGREFGGFFHESTQRFGGGRQRKINAQVNASVAEVSVGQTGQLVCLHQCCE